MRICFAPGCLFQTDTFVSRALSSRARTASPTPRSQSPCSSMAPCDPHTLSKLTSLKRNAIAEFEKQYRSLCQDSKKSGKAECDKEHIDVDLLKSLVTLRAFDRCSDVNELKNEQIKTWLHRQMKLTPCNAFVHLREVLRDAYYFADEKDPGGALLDFFYWCFNQAQREEPRTCDYGLSS